MLFESFDMIDEFSFNFILSSFKVTLVITILTINHLIIALTILFFTIYEVIVCLRINFNKIIRAFLTINIDLAFEDWWVKRVLLLSVLAILLKLWGLEWIHSV